MQTDNPAAGIAVIGLGAMGMSMATWLAKKHDVRGFDIDESRLAQAQERGVIPARTSRVAAQGAAVVILALRDAAQVEASLFGSDGVIDVGSTMPQVLVLTSTIGRDAAIALERRVRDAAGSRVAFVDAPVSGGPARAGRGELLVVVGGTHSARVAADAVLSELASTLVVVGEKVGDGHAQPTGRAASAMPSRS